MSTVLKFLLSWLLAFSALLTAAASGEDHDLVVYGATAGGVAAAVQGGRMGLEVVLIEPGRHLGGMTSGGLGATDFKEAEAVGGVAREFYQRVRKYYADPDAWKIERLGEYVSHGHDPKSDAMFFFEPHVAEKLLRQMATEAGVSVVYGERLERPGGVRKIGARISTIRMESGREFTGRMFVDATYEGDLLADAGVPYEVGRESNATYGETMNGVQKRRVPYSGHNFFRPVDPYVIQGDRASGLLFGVQSEPPGEEGQADRRVQAYCFRLCMTDVPENRVPFPKPEGYDPDWYELLLRYLRTEGTDLVFLDHPKPFDIEHPGLGRRPFVVAMPNRKTDMNSKGAVSSNLPGFNYDYPNGDYATRERIVTLHKRWHQGMLWFLQNDPRVPAKYREPLQAWGLAKDEFQDTGHWPHQLYVREARRMIGEMVMTEHHCTGERIAEDSVGLGAYPMDSHVVQRYVDAEGWVRNEGNIGGRVPAPYPISYRCLIPKRADCENLLVPVCVSASHVAYGSIRMEPVYMILGQSAATAAAQAINAGVAVQQVEYPALRARLLRDKQRLTWPADPISHGSNPAMAPIRDVSGLPRVLLIGDSISIGYTLPVRKRLEGRANVHRVPQNASSTSFGLSRLDSWLGDGKWDVIHFNFGLHDAKLPPEGIRHAPPGRYEENLRQIVQRLKKTGAKLIWATTTPVPNGGVLSPTRRFGEIVVYNEAAKRVMEAEGVAINNLYDLMIPRLATMQQPKDVHFNGAGSDLLGEQVARSIEEALE